MDVRSQRVSAKEIDWQKGTMQFRLYFTCARQLPRKMLLHGYSRRSVSVLFNAPHFLICCCCCVRCCLFLCIANVVCDVGFTVVRFVSVGSLILNNSNANETSFKWTTVDSIWTSNCIGMIEDRTGYLTVDALKCTPPIVHWQIDH